MAATCVINGWPVKGYLDPSHPLQQLVAKTVRELTGEEPFALSTDGCGTPLFALTLGGMARAFGLIARAAAASPDANDDGGLAPRSAEAAVGLAMQQHPGMVAGEGRDVTELMRLLPGSVAKDGFEGVQLVGLADGSAVAVKISDGGDRARMPATVKLLEALGVDTAPLAGLGTAPVLGGGRQVGLLQATDFLSQDNPSAPVNEAL
jgi:L-asparaginase II